MTINSKPNPELERANTLSLQERDLLLSFDGEFKKLLKAGFYFVETGPPDSACVQETRALDFLNMIDKLELPWSNTCIVVKEFTPLLDAIAGNIEDFSDQFISQLANFSDKVTEQNCIFIFPVIPRPHLIFFRSISTKWKQQEINGSDIRVNFVFPSLEKNGVFIGDISEEIKEKLRKIKREKEKKKPRHDDKKRRFGFKRPPKGKYPSKKSKNRSTKPKSGKSGDRYFDRTPNNYDNRNTGEKKKRRRRRKRSKPQGTNDFSKKPQNTSSGSKKNE
ncbi:MAG: hypothetical protein ACFFC7_03845 [Candidatus Hermodarchaeota archaeon]